MCRPESERCVCVREREESLIYCVESAVCVECECRATANRTLSYLPRLLLRPRAYQRVSKRRAKRQHQAAELHHAQAQAKDCDADEDAEGLVAIRRERDGARRRALIALGVAGAQ